MDLDKYIETQEQRKLKLQTLEMKKHSLQKEVEFEQKLSKEKEKIKEYETELKNKGFSIKRVGHGIKIGLKKSAEGIRKQAPAISGYAKRAVSVVDVLADSPKSDSGSLFFGNKQNIKEPHSYFDKPKKKSKIEVYF